MTIPTRAWLLGLALPIVLGACSLLPGASPSAREAILRDVATHQAQWLTKGIDSYTFSIARRCFCPDFAPYDVTVVDGTVTKVTQEGRAVDPSEVRDLPKTVQELFAVAAALPPEAGVDIEWNAELGYPATISVDPIANAMDDEYALVVTNFRPAS